MRKEIQDSTKNCSLSVSRRGFLAGSAGLTFALSLGLLGSDSDAQAQTKFGDAWVTIGTDGRITIMSPAAEMGQGSMTSLPLIFADELGADWADVTVQQAPPNDELYGNPFFHGLMLTAASSSVLSYFSKVRMQAAQARMILHEAVAKEWGVPVKELTEEPSAILHSGSGRKVTFAEIAEFATLPVQPPEVTESDLKPWSAFRYIGKDVPRVDLPAKVNGTAEYSIDVRLPGMLYGTVLRAPIEGSAPADVDDADALKVPGVIKTVHLPYGVGVLANSAEAAIAAKDQLHVVWSKMGDPDTFDSEAVLETYAKAAGDLSAKTQVWAEKGNTHKAMQSAATVIEGSYRHDFVYHAQMEPLNAVVSINEAGDKVEIWCGTQAPTLAVAATAQALDIETNNITLHRTYLGGGFGRRGHRDQEFLVDAVLLAKAAQKPVKSIWTREDDIHNGRFRPMGAHHLRAGLDGEGKLIGFHQRIASESAMVYQDPVRYEAAGSKPIFAMLGTGDWSIEYNLPNRLSEHVRQYDGMRLSSVRGTGTPPNNFVIESFIDEIALKKDVDPLDFRLELLDGNTRAQAVLHRVAELSGWREPRNDGHGLGVSFELYETCMLASVADVSVDRESGEINIHHIWAVIDPGLAVQPDSIAAQMEGAIVWGIGMALSERITMTDGEVQQSNFHDYLVPRMSDIPPIHVEVIPTDNKPGGVGEAGVAMGAAPVGNAFATLTGVRLRHLPMTPERVLAALS